MALYRPTWKGPDGDVVHGRVWWLQTNVGGVRRRQSLGVRDKNAAELKAAEILRRLEMKEAGLPCMDGITEVAPLTLVTEYEAELRRRGSAAQHVQRTIQRVRDMLADVERLGDVTPAWIRRALALVAEKGVSAATVNGYRVALSGLFGWLVEDQRWPSNPVAHVKPVEKGESTRERRALSREELDRLVAAAPQRRGVAYLLAATSGLRRSELAALTWADIDLDAATLRVRATTAKNRREATQPLPPGTVAALRAWRAARGPFERVLDHVPSTKGLRRDLAKAGLPYQNEAGVCDVHALRATYATLLAKAGVPLPQAMRLMRHSTPALTAKTYTRLRLEDGHAAVAKIDGASDTPSLKVCS
jgi:integrase